MTWGLSFTWPDGMELEDEANRSDSGYIRWVQASLNRVLGLRLAVDGINGPATRSAVRSFQQRNGLTVDGIVGPQTERALKSAQNRVSAMGADDAPRARSGEACEVLNDFDFDLDALKPEHYSKLTAIAGRLINSASASVTITGHTDPVGTPDYNLALGKRRAEQAASALRTAMNRRQPGSSRQLSITVKSRGEREPISSDPAMNRRVEICLPPVNVSPEPPPAADSPPIAERFCCLLAPEQVNSIRSNDNIVDPGQLGQHGRWSEKNGIIYSRKAGFLDLAHIRDSCDTTHYVYTQLLQGKRTLLIKRRRVGGVLSPSILGNAAINQRPLRPMDVARAIAYDAGLGHEIATYYDMGTLGVDVGGHNSSFSPEDLCSNFLGTLLAERAIAAGGDFNTAVTTGLQTLILDLGGQSPSVTLGAFNLVNGRWVNFSRANFYQSITRPGYLMRRNFTPIPWPAGHSSDKPPPSYVTTPLPQVGYVYTYTHTEEAATLRLNVFFNKYIANIKRDAAARYGVNFDKP